MTIIGITGTIGAGKGTVVNYLMSHFGFKHFSVREYLIKTLKEKNLPINRDEFTKMANYLRMANNNPSYITDQLYEEALKSNQNCIIESIRTLGEIQSLRAKGSFYLLSVDAQIEERYRRVSAIRKSETDNVSFETFVANEKRESQSEDPNKQNLLGCIAEADFQLNNDGDIDALTAAIDEIIKTIAL
ncbi:MAG: AAA family ATPase [Chitinophagales bacterium]|jgi:dephospho-CoA kinase|nr:AAA family ATPase [Chitinophagales bacterium]